MANKLEESLKDRTWPQPPEDVKLGDYAHEGAVRYGRVETRSLRLHQQLSEPIPPGECAITSLCLGHETRIVGATSGKRSHLFCYDPGPRNDSVVDVGVLEGAKAVRRSLVAHPDGRVFGGVTETEPGEPGGYLFVFDSKLVYSSEFGAFAENYEKLAVPKEGEGIAALAIDAQMGAIYGLTTETGTFFVYDIDSGEVSLKRPVAEDGHFSSFLITDRCGTVYGAGSCGSLFIYEPHYCDGLRDLDRPIPSIQGRQFYNKWDSGVLNPATGLIYGAGTADGVLFELNPRNHKMRSLGKVIAEPRVRAMAMGLDGRVYGIAGNEDGMGHLFYYDLETHELADLGLLCAAQECFVPGYEFDAACTGRWGEIYFGESEWLSHLFIYQPPIRPKVVSEEPA